MSSIAASGDRNEEERQALEVAEDAREESWEFPSFCADLFAGKFDFSKVYPFPLQDPDDEKVGTEYIVKVLEFLKSNLDPEEVDKTGIIPDKVYKGLAELGMFGIKIPKEYGGLGFSQTNYNRIIHAVSSYCGSTAVLLSAHQSIGVPQPLKVFGTENQKKKWLPRLAKGEISAFALTENGVGSDPAQMTTTAVLSDDGEHWIINGEKLWCTNGVIADIIVVMAATPSKKTKSGREKKQISAFIVEKGTPGFEVIHRCEFMGLKGIQNGVLKFTDVKVPKENLLWEEGKGLKLALVTLNTGRLTLPAACTAAAKMGLQIGRDWCNERIQWGARIGEHESSGSRLVLAAGGSYILESVWRLTSGMADQAKSDIRIEASIAKLFCTGLGWRILDNALQLRGGRGFETQDSLRKRGEKPFPIERAMRDYRINMIIEGTSSIQRLFVAREALDMHLRIAGPIFDPRASIGAKLSTLVKLGFFYAFWYPKQWINFSFWPRFAWAGGFEGSYLRYLKRASHRLARTTFHAMLRHGPKLEKKQLLLGRIVDTGMFLFAISSVLSFYMTRKKQNKLSKGEAELVKMICIHLKSSAESSIQKVRPFSAHDKIVPISKAIMNGDYNWLEDNMVPLEGVDSSSGKLTEQSVTGELKDRHVANSGSAQNQTQKEA